MLKCSVGLIALSSLFLSGAAIAQEKIKVGVTATLEGTYTVLGEDGMRGHQTALNVLGKKVGDKELEFIVASTDATPDSAVRAVRKLIEQDKVQILLSPLSGDEGIAVKNFAKTHPELTFINAASGAQETTYVDPAPNFSATTWTARSGRWASANTLMTKRSIARSRPSAKTTPSSIRRCSASCSSSAVLADRSPTGNGCRLAQRTLPRLSPHCPTTSTQSISASAAPTPSTS